MRVLGTLIFLLALTLAGEGRASDIATGRFHSCAWDGVRGSRIKCWGLAYSYGNEMPRINRLLDLQAGADHNCAHYLDHDGHEQLECWGSNLFKQSIKPDLGHYSTIRDFSAGRWHTCTILTNLKLSSTIVCWGRDDYGQTTVPDNLPPTSEVYAGDGYSCGLLSNSQLVRCWGRVNGTFPLDQTVNKVGIGSLICSEAPRRELTCWLNSHSVLERQVYVLGHRQVVVSNRQIVELFGWPLSLRDRLLGQHVIDIAIADDHICLIDSAGTACYGNNIVGQTDIPSELKEIGPIFVRFDHLKAFLSRLSLKVYSFDKAALEALIRLVDFENPDSYRTLTYFTETFIRQLGYSHLQSTYLRNASEAMASLVPNLDRMNPNVQKFAMQFTVALLRTGKVLLKISDRKLIADIIASFGAKLATDSPQPAVEDCRTLAKIENAFALDPYLFNRSLSVAAYRGLFCVPSNL